ncbi:MAG: AMP-binding protein [Actinobacteria bacterium]|nr:AMP-binding protein [Actinomycetota bacterium]
MPIGSLLKELSRHALGTYADVIYRNALLRPDEEAFVYGGTRITWREYNERVNRTIAALDSLGAAKGDVIGLLSWNCLESFDILGAAMKGGFIFSPYNPRLSASDLERLIDYSEATVVFVGPEPVPVLEEIRPRLSRVRHYVTLESPAPDMLSHSDLLAEHSPDEPACRVSEDDPVYLIYTSGTTGVPRGALYTHARAMHNIAARLAETPVEAGDKTVLTLQLFHVAGMEAAQCFLCAGATDVILKTFEPRTLLQTIQDERATDVQIVPTTLAAIFALPDFEQFDLSSLKRIVYAASPMPVALLQRGMDLWGPIFCQFYGQTESGPIITALSRDKHVAAFGTPEEQKILLSVGHPAPGVHVRIVTEDETDVGVGEVGEIIVQSAHVMAGYWRRPGETAAAIVDGWLHTRDMGHFDERGYVYISGRKGDTIITGGENVMPREVEEVLYQHPSVSEVVVLGVPDPYWVERVHALLVLKSGETVAPEEIIEFCRQRLSRYKAPKSVEFVDSLPKNASGKIDKLVLKKRYA